MELARLVVEGGSQGSSCGPSARAEQVQGRVGTGRTFDEDFSASETETKGVGEDK